MPKVIPPWKKILENPDKLIEALDADGWEGIQSLSDEEIEVLSLCLEELRISGNSSTMRKLYEIDYWRKPPTWKDFVSDEFFLGNVCNPSIEDNYAGMFPKWREEMEKAFSTPEENLNQMIFTGAIGLGKTFIGVIIVLFKMMEALCLRSPLTYYGLSKATAITFSLFSVTQKQIKSGAFQDALNMLRMSPFFIEKITDNINHRKFSDRKVGFHNNLQLEAGSKAHEALGRNVLVSLVDEVNFRIEAEAAVAAQELISNIDRRLKSRFRKGHKNPGLLVIISSANTESDFLVQHINRERHNKSTKIFDFPWWEVAGQVKMDYCGDTFRVDIGDSLNPPYIVKDDSEVSEAYRIIDVPIEHLGEFEDDLPGSIRDLAGKSTGRITKLFPNIRNLVNTLSDNIDNPFKGNELALSIEPHKQEARKIQDFLRPEVFLARRGNQLFPKRHTNAPRFIHIDMSSGSMDALGISMVHPVGCVEIEKLDRVSSLREQLLKPVFELDFSLRITRDKSTREAIDLGEIRTFIWWLKKQHFNIKMVSCDLPNMSIETRSILKSLGFQTSYVSVDRTKEPYYILRQVVNEGRLKLYLHDYLMLELVNLEDLDKKIDHPEKFSVQWDVADMKYQPENGSKDIADSLAGAIFTAEQHEDSYQMPLLDTLEDRLRALQLEDKNPQSTTMTDGVPIDRIPIL
jgi:hypothetical protein